MENILNYESVLPKGFTGTFSFTNWTDEEFVGKWGKKEYHFPPQATSPIIIPEHTPLEIQSIRKKFAKDLAEREFTKTQEFAYLKSQERNADGSARLNSIHQAAAYSLDSLTPLIQKCLDPLPVKDAPVTRAVERPLEDVLSKDESGELNTIAVERNGDLIEEKKSLRRKALGK